MSSLLKYRIVKLERFVISEPLYYSEKYKSNNNKSYTVYYTDDDISFLPKHFYQKMTINFNGTFVAKIYKDRGNDTMFLGNYNNLNLSHSIPNIRPMNDFNKSEIDIFNRIIEFLSKNI